MDTKTCNRQWARSSRSQNHGHHPEYLADIVGPASEGEDLSFGIETGNGRKGYRNRPEEYIKKSIVGHRLLVQKSAAYRGDGVQY